MRRSTASLDDARDGHRPMKIGIIAGMLIILPALANARTIAWASSAELESARATADTVIVAYISSARQPRGGRGSCPVNGYVARVERGGRFAVGAPVGTSVPCVVFPGDKDDIRRIAMRHFADRTWARLYFRERQLVDYQPLRLIVAEQ